MYQFDVHLDDGRIIHAWGFTRSDVPCAMEEAGYHRNAIVKIKRKGAAPPDMTQPSASPIEDHAHEMAA